MVKMRIHYQKNDCDLNVNLPTITVIFVGILDATRRQIIERQQVL